ncbi:MAG TPA: polysaccharide biosynthesis C-terminal domain-containing protein [Ferruginibacter sp.]|nr:polysaccharide biosynthesis C-terminal domain-containing protein [Ferruginibacter sp.]
MSILSSLKALKANPAVKSLGIYTFTNFFGKSASFLLLFVFTNPLFITPSENGLLSLFSTSMLFLMPFLSMGIIHSTSIEFFKLRKEEFKSLFTTGFVMPLAVMLVSTILLYLFREKLQLTYGFPYMFIWLIPFITFLTFCNEQFFSLTRNNNEPGNFLKLNLTRIILELSISYILVVFLAWRWQGRIAGILVAYIVAGAFSFYYFISRGYLFGTIKKKYIYSELIYAIPIIAMQASIFCLSSSDRFFLSANTNDNNETVGIYSIASIFSSIIIVLCGAFIQYIFPKVYLHLSATPVNYPGILKHFKLYLYAMIGGTMAILLLTPAAYHFFINEKYHPAIKYVYLLTPGFFLWSIIYFFYSFLLFYKEKKKLLGLSLAGIICSLTFNYFFIRWWGTWGAAIANFSAYSVMLVLTLVFTRGYWKNFSQQKEASIHT